MIVKNQKKLDLLKKYFNKKNYICVDTEFDRRKTYYSTLSIITISDGKKTFIFDILKNPEQINFLREIFKSKKKLKIFHGGIQDIEIFLNNDLNIEPFFDTQIAAGFLGLDMNISYANLVKKYCKKNIDKSAQNENWLKRPITKFQINYLKKDVLYLKPIYVFQNKLLKKQKKINFAKEEFKILYKRIKYNNGINSKFKKKLGLQICKNKNFFNLIKFRNEKSKEKNLPKNWIIKDEDIISIIKNKKLDYINKNKFFSKKEISMLKKLFLKIFKIKVKKNSNVVKFKTLEFFRFLVSKKYSIDLNLIASKYDMQDYENAKKQSKWRKKIFYNIFEKISHGKKKFLINDFKSLYQ